MGAKNDSLKYMRKCINFFLFITCCLFFFFHLVPCRREEAMAQSGKWFSKLASFIDLTKIKGKYENIYECLVVSY